jgi:hypothetical protein
LLCISKCFSQNIIAGQINLLSVNQKWGKNLMLLNFAWKCFSNTGSIEAYLLYKELKNAAENNSDKTQTCGNLELASDSLQELSGGA